MSEKKKTGRPRKEIDKAIFEKLCGIQCTQQEICDWFNVSEKTLNAWCKRTYKQGFSQVFRQKRGIGKISLRRTQWQMAETSVPMAIFLGKQYLDQSDNKKDVEDVQERLDSKLDEVLGKIESAF